jgi:predicted nuclease with RNAse H fold
LSCAGIDVGGRRKGFDYVVVDGRRVVSGPQNLKTSREVLESLKRHRPTVIGVDSPCTCALDGDRSRAGERDLAREVCGIRWTPDLSRLDGNPYYEWVINGLELYRTLEAESVAQGWTVIEVFPTASWTRWSGARGKRPRSVWTQDALGAFALNDLPARRLNQDARDAIAAALTAQLYARGEYEAFEEIVVPRARSRS